MSAPSTVATTDASVKQVTKDVSQVKVTESKMDSKESKADEKEEAGESSDEEDEGEEKGATGDGEKKKKKKKKNKKKKTAAPAVNACGVHLFCQGPRTPVPNKLSPFNGNKAVKHRQQTSPVSVPVADCYQGKIMPEGEIQNHGGEFNTFRIGNEELRANDRNYSDILNDLREAAEVHRQVRGDFMRWVRPGLSMIEIAQYIENGTRAGLKAGSEPGARLKRGWGFPTGVSLNHVAAHYTPNYKDTTVLREGDVMKVDFGTQINGHIIDSAFTLAFDPRYDPLLTAVQEATNAGLKAAGIDVRLCDIGGEIQEVMESHEIELNGITYPIKCIRNLNGHNIGPYKIHNGKSVPIVRNKDQTKMEEGELYAIETFGSTGRGLVVEDMECSHYMKNFELDGQFRPLRTKAAKDLLRHIDTYHSTLAFARRWLDDEGCKGYLGGLKELCDADVVRPCPPLVDIKGSYTAQFEHTFFLKPSAKEILSRGDDY